MSEMIEFLSRLRVADEQLFEVRHISPNRGIFAGYFDDLEKLEESALLYKRDGNFYVTLNPVDPDCRHRVYNRLARAGKNSTKSTEIVRRTTLLIDFDPERLSGIPSTEAEHQDALNRAKQVKADLVELGWPDPMLTDSGNGAGLLYRIDLPVNDGSLVQRVLTELANRYNDASVKIDPSVHDPSRVTRLVGTFNCKGEDTRERPHRLARLIEAPDKLKTVPQAKLEALLQDSGEKPTIHPVEFSGFDVPAWLDDLGVEYVATQKPLGDIPGTWYSLPVCPSKGQGDGNSGIFQSDDGLTIRYKCHHQKCKDVGWKEIRTILDPTFPEVIASDPVDDVKNPHHLAETILRKYEHPDQSTIILVDGEVYTWDAGVWSLRTEKEIRRMITRHVKSEFDRVAREKEAAPHHVTTAIVSNVYAALTSMIETKAKPGTWITGTGPSPNDLMVCKNGVVDLRAFAEGRSDYLLPHSPRLFAMSKRAFAFDPEADEPTRWMQFLNEVWPGDAGSQALLQEFMGYCLTDDTKFQKFLMLVGIPRGGKGTIVRLLTELVGKENVHSVRLGQFSHRFALENAIGKSLLLIPDAKLPKGDKQPEIVELIKAITGRDMINIDRKNLTMVSLPLSLKIMITSNDLLALPDDSSALYKRMLTLQFTQAFEDQPEFDLDEKLVRELPGIALWAIEGWKRLQFTKQFTESQTGRAMTKKLEDAANPIVAFLGEECVIHSDAIIPKDDLFLAYQTWCDDHELPALTKNVFCGKVYSACPGVGDGRRAIDGPRVHCFLGITLRNTEADDEQSEIRVFKPATRATSSKSESTVAEAL